MGRHRIEFDPEVLLDCVERGLTQKELAEEFDVSIPTIAKTIAGIQREQGILMQYRSLQSLQLTKLQHRILDAITPEKIHSADLKDLVLAFKILKEKEHLIEGKPTEVKGLLAYLMKIEEEEAAISDKATVVEAVFEEVLNGREQKQDIYGEDIPEI